MKKSAVLVIGSGASFDIASGNVPLKSRPYRNPLDEPTDKWKLPLAKDLFDFKSRPHYYEEIGLDFDGVRVLGLRLAEEARRCPDAFPLERRLREFSAHTDVRTQRWFRDIPQYIRRVIATCEKEYAHDPDSYVHLLTWLLSESDHDLTIITTNYDTLLESALRYWEYTYESMDDYAATGRAVKLIKIHGSIDWWVPVCPETHDVRRELDGFDPLSDRRVPERSPQEPGVSILRNWQGSHWYPCLTAPLAGKGPADVVCPDSHLTSAREAMESATKLLVVGCSGLDEDLREFLASSLRQPLDLIHVVGPDPKPVIQNFVKDVPQFYRNVDRREVMCSFRDYVFGGTDESIKTFAEA